MSEQVPRLTGGILFGLILEAIKVKSQSRSSSWEETTDGLSNTEVMRAFVEIFLGEPQKKPRGGSYKKNVSDYKKCDTSKAEYLPFYDQTFIDLFQESVEQNKKDTLQVMSTFISEKLSNKKLGWLVSAIIETIQFDKTIDVSERFKISINETVPKSELSSITTIEIEPFLLDVMRYIFVNKIDNTLGKDTFREWYSQKGPKSPWKLSNTELGKSLPDVSIIRYSENTEQIDMEESDTKEKIDHFEEVRTDADEETDSKSEDESFVNQQVFNNSKVINQNANKIYNIGHVENIN